MYRCMPLSNAELLPDMSRPAVKSRKEGRVRKGEATMQSTISIAETTCLNGQASHLASSDTSRTSCNNGISCPSYVRLDQNSTSGDATNGLTRPRSLSKVLSQTTARAFSSAKRITSNSLRSLSISSLSSDRSASLLKRRHKSVGTRNISSTTSMTSYGSSHLDNTGQTAESEPKDLISHCCEPSIGSTMSHRTSLITSMPCKTSRTSRPKGEKTILMAKPTCMERHTPPFTCNSTRSNLGAKTSEIALPMQGEVRSLPGLSLTSVVGQVLRSSTDSATMLSLTLKLSLLGGSKSTAEQTFPTFKILTNCRLIIDPPAGYRIYMTMGATERHTMATGDNPWTYTVFFDKKSKSSNLRGSATGSTKSNTSISSLLDNFIEVLQGHREPKQISHCAFYAEGIMPAHQDLDLLLIQSKQPMCVVQQLQHGGITGSSAEDGLHFPAAQLHTDAPLRGLGNSVKAFTRFLMPAPLLTRTTLYSDTDIARFWRMIHEETGGSLHRDEVDEDEDEARLQESKVWSAPWM